MNSRYKSYFSYRWVIMFYSINKSDSPFIFIRLTQKCSSNCVGCNLPLLRDNNELNLDNLKVISNYINSNFFWNFQVTFLWYDFLNQYILDKIYSAWFVEIVFMIDYSDLMKYHTLIKASDYVKFFIQKNIYNSTDFKKSFSMLKYIVANELFHLRIDYIFDKLGFFTYLPYFKKYFPCKTIDNQKVSLIIWNNQVTLEFSSLDWDFSEECRILNAFKIDTHKQIGTLDNIEVSLDTLEIKTHIPFNCNKGITSLWSILDSNDTLFYNFNQAFSELQVRENMWTKEMCYYCLKNPIKY